MHVWFFKKSAAFASQIKKKKIKNMLMVGNCD